MHSITVKAPAKVNLFLKVLGKRKDSYHNILTIFERISLADTIKISKISKGIIVKSDKLITRNQKDNLAYKAAQLVLNHENTRSCRRAGLNLPYGRLCKAWPGVKIEIRKRIPVASGLGGGSSDAASTMIGINKLFRLRLNDKALLTIGKRLGADVPFFLLDTPFAMGRGRGDILEVVKSKAKFWHLIVNAGSKTSTKDIYGAFDTEYAGMPKRLTLRHGSGSSAELLSKRLTLRRGDVRIFSLSKLRMDYAEAESMLYNDLERAVSMKKGVISRVLKSLAQLLGKKMIVSGSGPSLFCLYGTRREAIKARGLVLKSVPERERSDWQIFIVKTS